jgi:glycosyltransferase involved in cell wall biosynthesis
VFVPRREANWTGGSNYLRIIKLGLQKLENDSSIKVVGKFPLLTKLSSQRFDQKIKMHLTRVIDLLTGSLGLNIPWPASPFSRRVLQWVPDLQHLAYPGFFTDDQISERKKRIAKSLSRGHSLYFSSFDSMNTFIEFYGELNNVAGVVRFSANLEKSTEFNDIKENNNCNVCLDSGFFYLPNQWWKHKNHELALIAFQEYRNKGGLNHLVLTGSEHDDRFPQWHEELQNRISKIEGVHALGLVSRSYQFWLYSQADLLLQPSLFEGWSTTIEEALFFGTPILASDLKVNIEQLKECYDSMVFKRNSVEDLAEKMALTIDRISETQLELRRTQRHDRFLSDLLAVIKSANSFAHQN